MKLNFRSLKRKLFGSSPGKKKKKHSSGIRKKAERIVSIILVVFMSMSLVSLVGPTDIFDNDSGPKKTTTASTTVNPDENSVFGLRRVNDTMTPIETDYDLFGGISDPEFFNNLYNEFGFECHFEEMYEGELLTWTFKFTCLLKVPQSSYNVMWFENETGEHFAVYEGIGSPSVEALLNEFNKQLPIASTSSTTVDEWLLANTEELIELKAGTYRINDFVNIGSNQEVYYGVFETPFICETTVEEDGVEVTAKFMGYIMETNPTLASPVLAYCGIIQFIVDNEIVNEIVGITIKLYANGEWYSTPIASDTDYALLVSTLPIDMFQNVAITSDTTFTNYAPKIYNTNFGDWFIANTNYIEVNSTK